MTFRRIYISVHPIGSVPIGASSAKSRFSASFIRFHLVPSGGTYFPTMLYDTGCSYAKVGCICQVA